MAEEIGNDNLNERGAQEQTDRSMGAGRGDNGETGVTRQPDDDAVHRPEGRDVPPSDTDRDPDSPWMGGG